MPPLDQDRCYAAAASRDARFDGHFVTAVRTTKIYCRPSCPAITPKRGNVEFHATAAAAQQRGFRACKRCLPDATPGSPAWDMRRDVVGRAMRLIADGEIERTGVRGLAVRLGYSERHLNRLLTDELGAGPLSIARARRAQTARLLIETTPMSLTDVAFAAGFGSIRQFNDTIREVYAATPRDLRAAALRRSSSPGGDGHGGRQHGGTQQGGRHHGGGQDGSGRPLPLDAASPLRLRLAFRSPFAVDDLVGWFAARAVPGLEEVASPPARATSYRRLVRTARGGADVRLELVPNSSAVIAEVTLDDPSDLPTVVERVRRLLDLDADPVAIDEHLARDPLLAPLVAARPGLRSPGSVDPFETGVRAIVGQQISVAGARTVLAHLVETMSASTNGLRLFPAPDDVADAPDEAFSMPTRRRDTIRRFAAAVASGDIVLDAGSDPDQARVDLLAIPGIGPWTADYVRMRALGDPDVALTTDLVAARSAERLGLARNRVEEHAERWAPWRTYATHHLWAAL